MQREQQKEWASYFAKCFKVPFQVYYIAELRDLTDEALKQNDLRLAFNIAKEEAKVMGAYLPGVDKNRHFRSTKVNLSS